MAPLAVASTGRIGREGRPGLTPPLYKEGNGRNGASQSFASCFSPFALPPFFCHGEGAWRRLIGGGKGFG